jgi:antitoxin HicB
LWYTVSYKVQDERRTGPRKIPLLFFRIDNGNEPVRDWLKGLDEGERRAIGTDLLRAQWRWPVGMPLLPPVGRWTFGDKNDLGDEAYRSCADLLTPRTPDRVARIYQKDEDYASRRHGFSSQAPKGVGVMSKRHMGSSIDSFLKEEGIFEEAQAQAVKEVVAWQLAEAMKKRKISKARMAALLKTSRTQVDRLLDPRRDITLSSLQRAAAMVGRRLMIELV